MISENQNNKDRDFCHIPSIFSYKIYVFIGKSTLRIPSKKPDGKHQVFIYGVLFPSVIDDYRAVIRGVRCFVNQFEIRIAGRDIVSVNAIVQCRRDNGSRIGG